MKHWWLLIGVLCCAGTATAQIETKLIAPGGAPLDRFGWSVAIAGNIAVVGAFLEDAQGTDSGAAYVYSGNDGEWSPEKRFLGWDAATGDQFGYAVSTSGDAIVVGSRWHGGCGSAYVYTFATDEWVEEAELSASDAATYDQFGYALSLAGDIVVVGAPGDDDAGPDTGSAYVFTSNGAGSWREEAKLIASDAGPAQALGTSVVIDGDTIVVGAPGSDYETGSAYVFTLGAEGWEEQAKLTASDAAMGDLFGASLALDGDTVVVGAKGDDGYTGSAYVFVRSGDVWNEQAKLSAFDPAVEDFFGYSVALDRDTAVVGSPWNDGVCTQSGSIYVFTRNGAEWSGRGKLSASDGAQDDQFGSSVSLDGDTVLVGSPQNDAAGDNSGAAYAIYGVGSIFIDGFEGGDWEAWSSHTP